MAIINNSKFPNIVVIKNEDEKYSADYMRVLRCTVEVSHKELNLFRLVSAPDQYILQSKVDSLVAGWDEKYVSLVQKRKMNSGKEAADDLTLNAVDLQNKIANILNETLNKYDGIDWERLKNKTPFPEQKPFPETKPSTNPEPKPIYIEPKLSFFDFVFRKSEKIKSLSQAHYSETVLRWNQREEVRINKHEEELKKWENKREKYVAEYKEKQAEYYRLQSISHAKVDEFRESVKNGNPEAVIEQMSLVLENSNYHGLFEKSYEILYKPDEKSILLSYSLPNPDDLPQTKAVKFVKATGELVETKISDKDKKSNFESAIYQICLRTIHEIFEADIYHNVENVLFNGVVKFVDGATGKDVKSCIVSLLVSKSKFSEIDLGRIDPKTCFKSLKGVSASTLASLTPIAPIIDMDKNDNRFVDGQIIAENLTEETNLAAMSWEDFEHLVRELFEKEFASRGGEVKITQASKDGGVDAVAFDPDPISGGKIVIQAKRYTKTVNVSAVRDLYGTVMNEGATKGILVTTADYGPDAYTFATGKPLTLLNGANLLHLLEKHGYKASIDIKAARAAML